MISSSDTTLFVADVCGTLVRDDTTLGLLAHHFSQQPKRQWRLQFLRLMTERLSPFRLAVGLLERITGKHILKHVLVRMLNNDTVHSLESSAKSYAQWLLAERTVTSVWDVLTPAIQEHRVVLASASLQPVVSALAEQLGIKYVASELESQKGILTGRYKHDLTGLKIQALSDLIGTDLKKQKYHAISDNLTDRELLDGAQKAFVVLHHELHRKRWTGLSATYLRFN